MKEEPAETESAEPEETPPASRSHHEGGVTEDTVMDEPAEATEKEEPKPTLGHSNPEAQICRHWAQKARFAQVHTSKHRLAYFGASWGQFRIPGLGQPNNCQPG